MNKRLIFVFFLLCSLVISFVPVVVGDVLGDNGEVFDDYYPIQYVLTSPTFTCAVGQVYVPSVSGVVSSVSVYLSKTDELAAGNISMVLCSLAGGAGARYYSGTLDSSYNLSTSLIGTDYELFTFTFSGSVEVDVGGYYGFLVYCNYRTTLDSSHYVRVAVSNFSTVGSNLFSYTMGAWVTSVDNEIIFSVNGVPDATPTPSPSPGGTQNVVPSSPFTPVPSYYMVLLVLFAVVAVLVGLYVTFEREQSNKGVALLFVLVGLVVFVVLIVGYFVGF